MSQYPPSDPYGPGPGAAPAPGDHYSGPPPHPLDSDPSYRPTLSGAPVPISDASYQMSGGVVGSGGPPPPAPFEHTYAPPPGSVPITSAVPPSSVTGLPSYQPPPPGPAGAPGPSYASGGGAGLGVTTTGLTHMPPQPTGGSSVVGAGGGGNVEKLHLHHGGPPGPTAVMAGGLSAPLAFRPTLPDIRSRAEAGLREYMGLQRRRFQVLAAGGEGKGMELKGLDERLRMQASMVLGDLRVLRGEVSDSVKEAEGQRWRRWLVGGIVGSIIPIGKALFPWTRQREEPRKKESSHVIVASNRLEYAFKKSKSLISRMLSATTRPGIASLAFFVFAVLYVFTNEVSLRVGRSVGKRLKKLTAKVEGGVEDLTEEDMKLLGGWRWRILSWVD